ncbi:MAG: DUF58 domain-containing protein [Deltaproteobacteria bacterium]|nr:DUF58 domain-containing protein [Deltaproteobacteria bacterium]
MATRIPSQIDRAFLERAWRRHLRVTREGLAFIFVTFGVGLAAFNTGNNLIFLVFGFLLSLIVLSGILSEIAIRGIVVERRPPEHSFAKHTCLVELAMTNTKKRTPSYSLEVEDIAEGLPTERRCYFLKIAAKSQQVATYRRTPEKRGLLSFVGFRIATRYPFGIFEKWRNVYAPGEVVVYPALLETGCLERDGFLQGTETPMGRVGAGSEVAGVREYRDGDEARAIHWRRSAALATLMVREHERDASSHLTIFLDNQKPAGASAEWDAAFEIAISRVATIAVTSVARGTAVEVAVRGARSPMVPAGASVYPILRFLALLQPVRIEDAMAFPVKIPRANTLEVKVAQQL